MGTKTVQEQPTAAVQARRTAAKRPAAKAEPAPAEQPYTPMADKDYWKIVKAYAEGKKTKTGGDYRQTWIEMTHAKAEHIAEFDNHVDDYKASNGINL